jgi:hypothetical protein
MGVEAGVSVGWVAGESLGSTSISSTSLWVFSGVVLDLSWWAIELGPDGLFSKGWSSSGAGGGAAGPEDPPLPRAALPLLAGILTIVESLMAVKLRENTSEYQTCGQFGLGLDLGVFLFDDS